MTAISEELSDLLPCPFCGGEGAYQTDTEEPGVFAEEWIGCLECGATTALEVWNLRSGNGGEVDIFEEGDDVTSAAVAWLPLAYNYPGDDGRHFTRYNMVVAFRAGMMWANGDDIGVTPSEAAYDAQALTGAAEFFENIATGADPAPLAFAQAIRRVLAKGNVK